MWFTCSIIKITVPIQIFAIIRQDILMNTLIMKHTVRHQRELNTFQHRGGLEDCGWRVSQKFIYHLGFCLAWKKIYTNDDGNQLHGERDKNCVACQKYTAFSLAPFLHARQHDRIPRLQSENLIIYTLACSINSQKWLMFRFCFLDQYANYMYALEKNVLKKHQRSSMEHKIIYY